MTQKDPVKVDQARVSFWSGSGWPTGQLYEVSTSFMLSSLLLKHYQWWVFFLFGPHIPKVLEASPKERPMNLQLPTSICTHLVLHPFLLNLKYVLSLKYVNVHYIIKMLRCSTADRQDWQVVRQSPQAY